MGSAPVTLTARASDESASGSDGVELLHAMPRKHASGTNKPQPPTSCIADMRGRQVESRCLLITNRLPSYRRVACHELAISDTSPPLYSI